jgi:uncharacterized protein (DUF1778 family)
MGHRIPLEDQRVKTIPVKVSAEEKQMIEDAARLDGQTTGSWLRSLGLKAARAKDGTRTKPRPLRR